MEVWKCARSIGAIGQFSTLPAPMAREIEAAIMPWNTAIGRGAGLDKLTAAPEWIGERKEPAERAWPFLETDEKPAERPFVKTEMLPALQFFLPVRDLAKKATYFRGVAKKAEVPGYPALVCGQHVMTLQSRRGEVIAQVAINEVNVAESPEIVT